MSLRTLRRRAAPIAVLSTLTVLAASSPLPARAQTTSDSTDVTPPSHGVGGSSAAGSALPSSAPAGALITADPSTGAAHASLPFDLPKARGHAQPSLALTYDSFDPAGAGGVGWSLNLPSIERKNSSGFPRFIDGPPGPPGTDPTKDPDDFVFGGAPLVPICVLGADGSCPGDPSITGFVALAGYTYFRTETDDFTRLFYSADHRTWSVQYQSGVWLYFGASAGDSSAIETHDVSVSPDANTLIYRWNLSRIVDESGNTVVYRWAALDSTDDGFTGGDQPTSVTGPGLKYLTDIYDTPTTNVSRTPPPLTDYAHHTQLFWRGTDGTRQYSPGWQSVYARVLGDVAVTSKTFTGQGERAIVRLYHLQYSPEAENAQRYLGAFELHGCTQTQRETNGVVADPMTWAYTATAQAGMACPMVTPTSMLYTPLPPFSPTVVRTYEVNPPLVTGSILTGVFDVNGDGVSDLVASANAPGYIGPNSHANPSGTAIPFALLVDDGATGSALLTVPYQAPQTGPLWAQPPDFLPSAHTALGNWVGDGQVNWLWYDGLPFFWDANAPVGSPGPQGTSETYSLATVTDAGTPGFVAVGPPPAAGTSASPYPTPCPAPFVCGPDDSPGGTVGTAEVNAEMNWQRGKGFDVDGDGLADMALVPQVPIQEDSEGTVQATYFTHQAKNGQITPYLRRTSQPAPAGYHIDDFHAVADMDGDGLADILEVVRVPGVGGSDVDIVWWKNRGDGRFGLGSPGYFTDFVFGGADGTAQTVDPQKSNIAIGDVTGDGLADVVALRNGTLYVYAQPPVAAYDPLKGFTLLGSIPHASTDDDAVVSLADVDGSGMLGVAISEVTKVTVYQLFPSVPRPGLLSTMEDPRRAQSQVQYQSVASLARAASPSWQTTLPTPLQVVVDIKSSGSFVGPGGTNDVYETKYAYTDPMYDARDATFVGFRVVEEDALGSVAGAPQTNTVTTYVPATCPNVSPGKPCTTGIDYGWHIRRRLPVAVQLTDASSGALLSTTTTSWAYRRTYQGLDGRSVRMVYASQVDEYDGEPGAAPSSGAPVNGLSPQQDETDGPWAWSGTTTIPGGSIDRRTTRKLDANGLETLSAAWGAVGIDTPIVTLRTWQVAPGDPSQWLYRPTQTLVGYGDSAASTLPQGGRESDFDYDALGRLTAESAPLTGTTPLYRANPGGATAPAPANASVNTASGAVLTLAAYTYDAFGNVTTVKGPSGRCSGTTYDSVYNELPVAESAYLGGCGVSPLTSTLTWDRGLQQVTEQIDPGSAATTWSYDLYGRLLEVDQPSAEALGATSSAALLVDWTNADQGNPAGYSVHVTTPSHDSFVVFDNFGRARYRLDEAETAGSWIVSGGAELAANGRPLEAYVPFAWSGNPVMPSGGPPSVAFTGNATGVTYDALGRPLVVTDPGGAVVTSTTYHPLKTEVRDGDELPGASHATSYTELVADGRGIPTSATRFLGDDPVDAITTSVSRLATGEITSVTRSHTAGSDTFVRSMQYDSLGRLTENFEPNTTARVSMGTFTALVGWRYAYDDAGDLVGTSDSRGCGENLVYDAVGRLTNEDYSPCSLEQAAYTPGYETFFTYDTPASTFAGTPGDYAGRLTSWGDRASRTEVQYDPRGRPTAVARQLALPNDTGADVPFASRYAPHVFARSVDYDDANRVTTKTTGADAAALGLGADPYLTNHYTPRGTLGSIDGTYGTLLKSATFNPDGTPQQTVLGDVANTTIDYGYWPNGRLQTAHVHRPAGPWSHAAGYVAPGSAVPTTLEDDLANVSVDYDNAGNPLRVADTSTANWPAGALPASSTMTYDDEYRLRSVSTTYGAGGGSDTFSFPPYAPEAAAGSTFFPPRPAGVTTRVQSQTFAYDWLGNTTASSDDQNAFGDRSLGAITNGGTGAGPNQLTAAVLGGSGAAASYDASGNLLSIHVVHAAPCTSQCTTDYAYGWDELGQLATASRTYATNPRLPTPRAVPAVTLRPNAVVQSYVYGADRRRVLTATTTTATQGTTYSADVYDTLRLEGTTFPDANGDYARSEATQAVVLSSGGERLGRVVYSATDPQAAPDTPKEYVFLEVGDRIGSTSFVLDQATSELVERPTYQAFGAAESDFRTARWSNFRETVRYTGHEDAAEVGLVYFGHRYYSPILSRWASPDPLTIHGLGSDLNPYAFVRGSPLGYVDPTGLGECDPSSQSCASPPPPPCVDSSCGDEEGGPTGGVGGSSGTGTVGPGAASQQPNMSDPIRPYPPAPAPGHMPSSPEYGSPYTEIRPTARVYKPFRGWVYEEGKSIAVRLPDADRRADILPFMPLVMVVLTDGLSAGVTIVEEMVGAEGGEALVEGGEVWNARGGVDFSKSTAFEGQVQIQYTGSRTLDYQAANQAAGLGDSMRAPAGFVWHHLDDYNALTNTGTMQLVDQAAHMANAPHIGGVAQWVEWMGVPYAP